MRIIKFRGIVKWNGNYLFSDDWIEGSYVCKELSDEHYIYIERNYPYKTGIDVEIKKGTLSQFTGFCDKRKQELFEGHIVFDSAHHTSLVVYFSDKGTWRVKSANGKLDSTLYSRLSVIEIVGDIHLSPDELR